MGSYGGIGVDKQDNAASKTAALLRLDFSGLQQRFWDVSIIKTQFCDNIAKSLNH